jgi:hypothetical protein
MTLADMALLNQRNVLIHAEAKSIVSKKRNSSDINLTSPAATLALGLCISALNAKTSRTC